MSKSTLGLLVSLAGVVIYSYSAYFMHANGGKMSTIIAPELKPYGHIKFLTYQCLIIQLLSSLLHVGAHFSRSLIGPRDLVFTTLAYPVGSIVVYTFWSVWIFIGREFIFPTAMSQFYPDWLNHATHTIIAPLNLILISSISYKYTKKAALLTVIYFGLYTALLHYIKFKTGLFVYKYLDNMNDNERIVYFILTGVFAYVMYKSGQFLSKLLHSKSSPSRPFTAPAKKKQK